MQAAPISLKHLELQSASEEATTEGALLGPYAESCNMLAGLLSDDTEETAVHHSNNCRIPCRKQIHLQQNRGMLGTT